MLFNGSLLLAAASITVAYVISRMYKKWSWVFNVPGTSLFKKDNLGDMKKVFELKDKFGEQMVNAYGRLYRIIANGNPVLVIADPTYCQQLYQGNGVLAHERGLGLGNFFERHLGDCMACLNGKDWTR